MSRGGLIARVPVYVLMAASAAVALAGTAAAATIEVGTVDDAETADGLCSLREAIVAANTDTAHLDCPAGSGADRIVFDLVFPASILLDDDLPEITGSVRISGPGMDQLFLGGRGLHRLIDFDTPSGGFLMIDELALIDGRSPGGSDGNGGAVSIARGETALLRRVHFFENRSLNGGGALALDSDPSAPASVTMVECYFESNEAQGVLGGGGILVSGTGGELRVIRSTFDDNFASDSNGDGGAIAAFRAAVELRSTTISGNQANSGGAGVRFQVSGPQPVSGSLVVIDSTITRNLANADGDLVGEGGGLSLSVQTGQTGTLEIVNSVVAGNFDSGAQVRPDLDCAPDLVLLTGESSFVGANNGCETHLPAGSPNAGGAWVGTVASPLDAGLEVLAPNGGPVPTHLPSVTAATALGISPLIDLGSCPGTVLDQRGYGNPLNGFRRVDVAAIPNPSGGDGCDVGAVEVNAAAIDPPLIFADGFESGTTLLWSAENLP